MSESFNDWSFTRSYASEALCRRFVASEGLDKIACSILVAIPSGPKAGRFTMIFGKSFCDAANIPFAVVASRGFKVVG